MWYEALPCMFIIGTLVYSYQITGCMIHKAFFGTNQRRDLEDPWQRTLFERDARISGAPWINPGLDNIPDEEPKRK